MCCGSVCGVGWGFVWGRFYGLEWTWLHRWILSVVCRGLYLDPAHSLIIASYFTMIQVYAWPRYGLGMAPFLR
ncbi:hypothetical protein BDZ94DRAFT_1270430 [Collybia nuda]|uniref:Uncharacterized protein n=1 Tax=Collybia nuda TaxID=64659 RepID=A0A9P6CAJ6_9AGAR|nr:hypothetical protein BDZ94DRAFT_1270430 [Collybia nuda]